MRNNIHIEKATLIEYVTFISKDGIEDKDLKKAIFDTDTVLNNIKGFIQRDIGKQENGIWVEVVYWENKELAEKGLEEFLNHPISKLLLTLIDSDSIKIEYSNILKA